MSPFLLGFRSHNALCCEPANDFVFGYLPIGVLTVDRCDEPRLEILIVREYDCLVVGHLQQNCESELSGPEPQ